MDKVKRRRLETKGWKVGSASEFLGLSEAESALVEIKARLAMAIAERRRKRGWTQKDLADRIESSQSRIAKIEAGDASVSLDLLVRSFFALEAGPLDLAKTISPSPIPSAERRVSFSRATTARLARKRSPAKAKHR